MRVLFVLFLLVLSAPAFAHHDQQLKIDVIAPQDAVKNTEDFAVTTIIRNTGPTEQKLLIWLCSYNDHWQSDNASVTVVVVPCDKNYLKPVTLKPGEPYERELTVHLSVPAEEILQEKVTFRLGFQPRLENSDETEKLPVTWSDPVTVSVKENVK